MFRQFLAVSCSSPPINVIQNIRLVDFWWISTFKTFRITRSTASSSKCMVCPTRTSAFKQLRAVLFSGTRSSVFCNIERRRRRLKQTSLFAYVLCCHVLPSLVAAVWRSMSSFQYCMLITTRHNWQRKINVQCKLTMTYLVWTIFTLGLYCLIHRISHCRHYYHHYHHFICATRYIMFYWRTNIR